ncbi:unnamed protein product [Knipowitschia caucasica]|uniref:Ig-like domain-containing protein n=1 Tax=Knipowitschia caucasica TaxID=637954 RepID=A0AAV2MSZ8_KNICA
MSLRNVFLLVSVCGLGLTLLIKDAESMVHSLMYFHTSSTDVTNFPEFVAVGYVNGLQITHYDSNTKRVVPKQKWMEKITEDDPQYWDRNTELHLNSEMVDKVNTEIVKQRLNQTEGSHMWQRMAGCEWNNETNEINGYDQYGFDGEDFIAFDLKTETFVTPRPEAVATKHKWERIGETDGWKHYITHICVDYLKRHVRNGQSVLMRKELPLVSFLQKSPSAPVTCHATGFYPDKALLFWTIDGDELHDGVEFWEILPNNDDTFQMSTDIDLSSVPPEDWGRYQCVFRLLGKPDMYFRLDPDKIRTNAKKHTGLIAAAVSVSVLALFAVVGFALYRWCKAKQITPPPSEAGVQRELVPGSVSTEAEEAEQPLAPGPQ